LISTAEHYEQVFEPLKRWYKFRTEFIKFIDGVDIQKQLFDQNLECLLRFIDTEEDELQRLTQKPEVCGVATPRLMSTS